jgi:chlorophyllide a reductase subunit Y
MSVGAMLAPMGVEVGPVVPAREWRELYAALACDAVAMVHPFYTASVREFAAAGRPCLGSAPVGVEGTAAWLRSVGDAFGVAEARVGAAVDAATGALRGALSQARIDGTVTVSGYEGSELLVARLLVECGARVPYVGTACPRTPWSEADREWLEAHGATVRYRASLEDDLAAAMDVRPDLAIGTTPVVQKVKEAGIPALYFTNLISARPLLGAPGPGSLAQVVNAAMGNRDRMARMRGFFEAVGAGDAAGVWEGAPNVRADFRAANVKKMERRAKAAEAERMI